MESSSQRKDMRVSVKRLMVGRSNWTPVALVFLAATGFGGRHVLGGPMDDYAALEIQMEVAAEEFYEAFEESGPDALDKRSDVLARMDKLVNSSAGTPDGGLIAVGTFLWSLETDSDNSFKRFKALARDYKDAPNLSDTFEAVPYIYTSSSKPKSWIKELEKLASASSVVDTKAGAHFAAGKIQLDEKNLKKAKAGFESARKIGPDSIYAMTAKGYIFEIEHLQVGMVAPDFKIKTLEGKETSLASLRGKAVLLNFWASW